MSKETEVLEVWQTLKAARDEAVLLSELLLGLDLIPQAQQATTLAADLSARVIEWLDTQVRGAIAEGQSEAA